MKVMIAESSYPADFYNRALDGNSVSSLLNTIRIENELRYVLDMEHLRKCIVECSEKKYDVLHISTHGDETGIALADNSSPTWDQFAELFDGIDNCPAVLVMSACCGGASGISGAFKHIAGGPGIIFGSTDALHFSEYAVAWSILYHNLKTKGLNRDAAQTSLKHITATVHRSFIYRRWDEKRQQYVHFPTKDKTFEVREVSLASTSRVLSTSRK